TGRRARPAPASSPCVVCRCVLLSDGLPWTPPVKDFQEVLHCSVGVRADEARTVLSVLRMHGLEARATGVWLGRLAQAKDGLDSPVRATDARARSPCHERGVGETPTLQQLPYMPK
ncbi:MAG: hypothetical protein NZ843_05700, partial [Fimbriimonadales bacterium]|nr:hypothetical protein [Fimbriimonadales bacterium]